MPKTFDVITIGAATVDIFAKSLQYRVADGLISLPSSSKNEISHSLICSGGGATNASVSFSRLKLNTACLALLGSDPLSTFVLNDLQTYKVDSSLLVRPQTESTDYSIILVSQDGGRTILTNRGNSYLQDKHITWSKIAHTKWFYITSLEGNLDLLEKLIGFALENKIKISLNPGRRELSKRQALIPLLQHVDFLLLNKEESETLTNLSITHPDFWNKLLSFKSKIIAVTNGRHGAHILTPDQNLFSPVINTQLVDETGAGDSFGSTFVASLIYGHTLDTSLLWALKNSASVVSHLGAKTGLLTKNKIKSIIQ